MDERRGHGSNGDRFVAYCDGCKRTSVFKRVRIAERVGGEFKTVFVCLGNEREGEKQGGCGKILQKRQ